MSTKTNTVEAPSPVKIAKQIEEKAAFEIASLEAQLATLTDQEEALRQEREAILSEQAQRTDRLGALKSTLSKHEQAYKAARDYASIATGTLGESEAIKRVKECEHPLEQARANVSEFEGPYQEQEQVATTRLAEIDTELQRIPQIQARKADVTRVRDRDVNELGESTYGRLLKEYQDHQEKIGTARQQLVDHLVEKAHFLDHAQETLASWPALAHKFELEGPYEDATSRILTAARDYVERLVEDGPQLAHRMDVPAVNHADGQNWMTLLEVLRQDLYIIEHVSSGRRNRALTHRLQVLNELLSQYVASKR